MVWLEVFQARGMTWVKMLRGNKLSGVWADPSDKSWGDGELSSGAGEGFGAGTLHDLLTP